MNFYAIITVIFELNSLARVWSVINFFFPLKIDLIPSLTHDFGRQYINQEQSTSDIW